MPRVRVSQKISVSIGACAMPICINLPAFCIPAGEWRLEPLPGADLSLVKPDVVYRVVRTCTSRISLVVVPCVASKALGDLEYKDDKLPPENHIDPRFKPWMLPACLQVGEID